jgi:hypothetical protein
MTPAPNVTDHPLAGIFSVDADGVWHHDDVRITHERTWKYFSSLLACDEAGVPHISDGLVRVDVRVADAALIVMAIRMTDEGIRLFFHDDTNELLKPETLFFKGDTPYCRVRNELSARFSRSAWFQLAEHIVRQRDGYSLIVMEKKYPIRP